MGVCKKREPIKARILAKKTRQREVEDPRKRGANFGPKKYRYVDLLTPWQQKQTEVSTGETRRKEDQKGEAMKRAKPNAIRMKTARGEKNVGGKVKGEAIQ